MITSTRSGGNVTSPSEREHPAPYPGIAIRTATMYPGVKVRTSRYRETDADAHAENAGPGPATWRTFRSLGPDAMRKLFRV